MVSPTGSRQALRRCLSSGAFGGRNLIAGPVFRGQSKEGGRCGTSPIGSTALIRECESSERVLAAREGNVFKGEEIRRMCDGGGA